MTGALANLVARVTGQVQPRLRPRLASRFEGGGVAADGFREVVSERVVRAAAAPSPAQTQAPLSPSATAFEPPAPMLVQHLPPPSEPAPAPPRTEGRVEREPAPEPLRRAGPPAPLTPAAEPIAVAVGREPLAPGAGVAAPAEQAEPLDIAPPPLLLPQPERTAERAIAADPLATAQPERPQAARLDRNAAARAARGAEPEPPEIVIQIGRIDLRTPPSPAQAAAPQRRPRPKGSDLGDYLRGKGGKR